MTTDETHQLTTLTVEQAQILVHVARGAGDPSLNSLTTGEASCVTLLAPECSLPASIAS